MRRVLRNWNMARANHIRDLAGGGHPDSSDICHLNRRDVICAQAYLLHTHSHLHVASHNGRLHMFTLPSINRELYYAKCHFNRNHVSKYPWEVFS